MKYLRKGLLFFLFLLIVILPSASLAEDASPTVKKKEESVGRVTLESKEYPLDHYKLEANIGNGIMEAGDRALHAINQGLWGFNKTIASFTLYSVNKLMSFDLISLISDEISVMSKRIYEVVSGTFLSLFVVLVGGTAAWRYFVNQQVGLAVKALIGALVIMALTFWFYSDTSTHVKWINDRGTELEGIASSTNLLVTSDGFDSNEAYNPKEGLAVLENQLFNLMVKRPYLLLHYGSTKESEIVSEDPNRVDKFLEVKPYSEEGKSKRKDIVNKEVSELENKYMTPEFSGERFGYLLVTLISTLAVSVPVLLLGIFKFLLQVWLLALIIFTAIPLTLSLIPSYSETALNHFKKLIGVLLMKAGLVLLIAVMNGIVALLYESVKVTNGVEGYAFVVFLIVITMFGLFKYRGEIFEVASAGMIQGQQSVERMTHSAFDKMENWRDKTFRMADKGYRRYQQKQGQKGSDRMTSDGKRQSDTANGRAEKVKPSKHRQPDGQNQAKERKAADQASGKNGKDSAASKVAGTTSKSAARDAKGSVTNMDEYRKKKEEGAVNKNASPSRSNRAEERPKSAKRNPSSSPRQQQENSSRQSPLRDPNPMSRAKERNSVPHQPIDPNKPITKWEAQQQVNARNKGSASNSSPSRSSKRDPKPPKAQPERQTQKGK